MHKKIKILKEANMQQFLRALKLSFTEVDIDYTSINLRKAIFLLSVPMVLEMFLNSIFSLVDMYFVSQLGSDAVATIGLTEAVINIVYATGIGISIATTALISRRIGEKKYRLAAETALQSIWIGLSVSIIIAIPGTIFTSNILHLMGANQIMSEHMSGYMTISLGGSFSIIMIFINNAIFRSSGKPLLALKSLALANLLNIVLDPILILGIGNWNGLGINGAAWASFTGRGTAIIYQLFILFKSTNTISLMKARKLFDFQISKSIIKLSTGGISQNIAANISWLFLTKIVSSCGSIAMASYTIALRILLFVLLPIIGIANATSTLVGQNLGAKKLERAVKTVKITGLTGSVIMIVVGLVFFIFAENIVSIFATEPGTIIGAKKGLKFLSIGFPIYALGMVMINALNGAGDTRTPFKINLVSYLVIQILLAFTLSHGFELKETGVYISILAAESIFTLAGIYFFAKGKWKHTKI